jgi:2,3-dihydroxy-p-cumate/2,3-dihydroxybenzoate 3,4-dioxygenase
MLPMIRHLVTFTVAEHVPETEREQLLSEIQQLPRRFSSMRNWSMGTNISKRDQTFEYAFVVDFASEEELVAYLDSEHHQTFVRDRFRPNVSQRAIVSFEFETAH